MISSRRHDHEIYQVGVIFVKRIKFKLHVNPQLLF